MACNEKVEREGRKIHESTVHNIKGAEDKGQESENELSIQAANHSDLNVAADDPENCLMNDNKLEATYLHLHEIYLL